MERHLEASRSEPERALPKPNSMTAGHVICPGCKQEIDPEVCHCGEYRAGHSSFSDHSFVPMGCECGRVKIEDVPIFAPNCQ